MSWYEEIDDYLEKTNDTDIEITIDDIDEKSITFSVYEVEVTNEVLEILAEVLDFIKKGDINLWGIMTQHNMNYNGAGCFSLEYNIEVGKDEESEDELYQRTQDDLNEQAYKSWRESKNECK